MTFPLRRVALIVHVICSVGWIGALASFLALCFAALNSQDGVIVRSAYLAMNLLGCWVIVPLSLAAVASGLVQAMGTEWGILRHRWIVTKLILTVVATAILLVKVPLIEHAADLAVETSPNPELRMCGMQLAIHAAGGLFVLITITAISVVKPWGTTRFGQRRLPKTSDATTTRARPVTTQMPAAWMSWRGVLELSASVLGSRHAALFNRIPLSLKVLHVVFGLGIVGMVYLHLAVHGFLGHTQG